MSQRVLKIKKDLRSDLKALNEDIVRKEKERKGEVREEKESLSTFSRLMGGQGGGHQQQTGETDSRVAGRQTSIS